MQKEYAGQKYMEEHRPIFLWKVNQAGVIPIIFAISILLFPQMLGNFMQLSGMEWIQMPDDRFQGFSRRADFCTGFISRW